MKKRVWNAGGSVLLCVIAVALFLVACEGQENTATVIEVVNRVDAHPHPEDDWQPAMERMVIYAGGLVRTGIDSSARLELLEGMVRLSADSIFTVKENATRQGRLLTTLFLQEGRLWANLTTDQPHEFTVETGNAVAAVRDTHFSVRSTEGETLVSVAEGEVELTAQGQSVTVVAGQQAIAEQGQPPTPPQPMSDEERALWATEGEMPELVTPTSTPTPTEVPTPTQAPTPIPVPPTPTSTPTLVQPTSTLAPVLPTPSSLPATTLTPMPDYSNLPLRPVGFVNHGPYDAVVRPWTYVPQGSDAPAPPPAASTVSFSPDSPGLWPGSSRFLDLPLGTFTWCIDWTDDEDQDGDGYFDYYHYLDDRPVVLDENDSTDPELGESVDIQTDPAGKQPGRCGMSSLGQVLAPGQTVGTGVIVTLKPGQPSSLSADGESQTTLLIDVNPNASCWGGSDILGDGLYVMAETSLGTIDWPGPVDPADLPVEVSLTAGTSPGRAEVTIDVSYCPPPGVIVYGVCSDMLSHYRRCMAQFTIAISSGPVVVAQGTFQNYFCEHVACTKNTLELEFYPEGGPVQGTGIIVYEDGIQFTFEFQGEGDSTGQADGSVGISMEGYDDMLMWQAEYADGVFEGFMWNPELEDSELMWFSLTY